MSIQSNNQPTKKLAIKKQSIVVLSAPRQNSNSQPGIAEPGAQRYPTFDC